MEDITIRETLGKKIKQKREMLGTSLTALATKLGIGKDRLQKIEKGERPISAEILISLAETFDVSLDELLGLSREKDRVFLIGFEQVKIITACGTFEVCSERIKVSF